MIPDIFTQSICTASMALFLCIASATGQTGRTNITTSVGTVYSNVVVQRVEPDGITLLTKTGVQKIGFEGLSEVVRMQYHYDPAEAVEYARQTNLLRTQAAQKAQQASTSQPRSQQAVPECKVSSSPPWGIAEPGARYFNIHYKSARVHFEEKEVQSVVSALRDFLRMAEKVDSQMPDYHKPLLQRSYNYMGPKKCEVLGIDIVNGRPLLRSGGSQASVEDAAGLLRFLENWSVAQWDANLRRTKAALGQ